MEVNRDEAAAFARCEAIARREGKNFHWGFRFLSPEKRRALCALYAFARATDDIVDDDTSPVEERGRKIDRWRRDLEFALDRGASSDLVLRATALASARFAIPRDELLLLVEGCRDDLSVRRYESIDSTLAYCRKVAVTVGMAMLAIFEAEGRESRDAMTAIGYAFQLTNILRDIPEDLARDRIYLPLEMLRRHGVVEEDLRVGPPSIRLRAIVCEVAALAERRYSDATPLFRLLEPGAARTMKAMWRIYRGILMEIRRADGDVWSTRPGISGVRKAAIVMATSLGL